jgi:hypothetical protein
MVEIHPRRSVEEPAVRMASHRATAQQKVEMLQLAEELEGLGDAEDLRAHGRWAPALRTAKTSPDCGLEGQDGVFRVPVQQVEPVGAAGAMLDEDVGNAGLLELRKQ